MYDGEYKTPYFPVWHHYQITNQFEPFSNCKIMKMDSFDLIRENEHVTHLYENRDKTYMYSITMNGIVLQ